jgi:1,4-alpha-glucan branching enzyme
VVHGKGSLLGKMPGDEWHRWANLRALYGYMFTHPGKKLLFMGAEFGQRSEWSHERSLDWHELEEPPSRGLQRWVRDLNTLVRGEPALHEQDFEPAGFEWIDANDSQQSVISFVRWDRARRRPVVTLCNFTPVPRHDYRIGVPLAGVWAECLNSDAPLYGGSGQGNAGAVETAPVATHGRSQSLSVTVPPLGAVMFRPGRP